MSLPISELFLALQGEGIRMGYPSIFVRTGGCNLSCQGFGVRYEVGEETKVGCDSYYSVDKHFKDKWERIDTGDEMFLIIKEMCSWNLPKQGYPDIVFTGGEPLIHHNNKVMLDLVKNLLAYGYPVWFETNGTINLSTADDIYRRCSYMISPKLENSGETLGDRFTAEALKFLCEETKEAAFKFVCSKDSIEDDVKVIKDAYSQFTSNIFLMPMGDVTKELENNAKVVYEAALENGWKYSDRLHIRIYEDARLV